MSGARGCFWGLDLELAERPRRRRSPRRALVHQVRAEPRDAGDRPAERGEEHDAGVDQLRDVRRGPSTAIAGGLGGGDRAELEILGLVATRARAARASRHSTSVFRRCAWTVRSMMPWRRVRLASSLVSTCGAMITSLVANVEITYRSR